MQAIFQQNKSKLSLNIQSYVYDVLAKNQSLNGQTALAQESLQLAHKAFFANSAYDTHFKHEAANFLLDDGVTHLFLSQPEAALQTFTQIIRLDDLTVSIPLSKRLLPEVVNNMTLALLKIPQKDMEQIIFCWHTGLQGALSLRSEQRFKESVHLQTIMEIVWPGEKVLWNCATILCIGRHITIQDLEGSQRKEDSFESLQGLYTINSIFQWKTLAITAQGMLEIADYVEQNRARLAQEAARPIISLPEDRYYIEQVSATEYQVRERLEASLNSPYDPVIRLFGNQSAGRKLRYQAYAFAGHLNAYQSQLDEAYGPWIRHAALVKTVQNEHGDDAFVH